MSNVVPKDHIRVEAAKLREFVFKAGRAIGLPEDKAALLAELLAGSDLKGNFSHGTQAIGRYCHAMLKGQINNNPQVKVVEETENSLVVDGDGGLGYFPCYEGTLALIEKLKDKSIGILLTRNHGHIGAAAIYASLTLEHDLLSFVTSGVQLRLAPGLPVYRAAGGSPMAFSAPAGEEAGLLLDFGTMHDLYERDPHRDEIARLAPGIVLRHIGLGAICQTWSGLLAGLHVDESRAERKFEGANQGALMIAFKLSLFMPPEQFKKEMDEYVRAVRKLKPIDGLDQAYLPGGPEAEHVEAFTREGIPVGPRHQMALERVAEEFGLERPWRK
jgi:LDH2 family malate/lactate/ureidoglycolate dehydrogenase